MEISKDENKIAILTIIILGFIVYGFSLFNGFVWDDLSLIVNNPLAHSLSNIPVFLFKENITLHATGPFLGSYYRPIPAISFVFLYSMFGNNAFFYHLFQLVFHITNAILVYFLFKKFIESRISLFLALIFLIHPINTESVIYVAALQEILFVFFGLTTLNIYIYQREQKRKLCFIALFLLLSLFSKETGLLFFGLFLLYTLLFKLNQTKKAVSIIFGLSALYICIKLLLYGHYYQRINTPLTMSFNERIIGLPSYLLYYLKTFLFPKDLSIAQYWSTPATPFASSILEIVMLVISSSIFAFLVWFWKKSKQESFKILIFFSIWFLIGWLFHSQIFQLDLSVSDRWFYFTIIGLLGTIGVVSNKVKLRIGYLKTVYVIAISLLIILSLRTIVRTFDWKNPFTLYSHDQKISQNNFYLENNLGVEYLNLKQIEQAQTHLEKSVQIYPEWDLNNYNLGYLYAQLNQNEKAGLLFQKAYVNSKGSYLPAVINYAVYLQHYVSPKKAAQFASEQLRRYPGQKDLYAILIMSLTQDDRQNEALSIAKEFSERYPSTFSRNIYDETAKKSVVKY